MENTQQTFVIGLGGSGKKVIAHLKKLIEENSPHGIDDYKYLRFLSIDTDDAYTAAKSQIKSINSSNLEINAQEIFQLDVPHISDISDLKEKCPDNWFLPKEYEAYLGNFDKGAGQKKALGRFPLSYNAEKIYSKINSIMSNMLPQGADKGNIDNKHMNVFICGSICGGTGSGTFLDIAYMVRSISALVPSEVKIFGILATSTVFKNIQGNFSIASNDYASLVELDYFMNPTNYTNPNRNFNNQYIYGKNYEPGKLTNKPFDCPIIFEGFNAAGTSMNDVESYGEMSARFIYLMAGSQVQKDWNSQDNNVNAKIGTIKSKNNKPVDYRGLGIYSIVYPVRMIKQLCGMEFARDYYKEMLKDSCTDLEYSNQACKFIDSNFSNIEFELCKDVNSYIESLEKLKNKDTERFNKKEINNTLMDCEYELDSKFSNKTSDESKLVEKKKGFIKNLNIKLNQLSSLDQYVDDANDGKNFVGSLVQARKFLSAVKANLEEQQTRFSTGMDNYDSSTKRENQIAYERACNELKKTFLGVGAGEKCDSVFRSFIMKEKGESAYFEDSMRHQLLTGIKKEGITVERGIIDEINAKISLYERIESDFSTTLEKLENEIKDNNTFSGGESSSETVFNYEKDVKASYENMKEKNPEAIKHLSETVSKNVNTDDEKESLFESAFKNISSFKRNIEKSAEEYVSQNINFGNICERLESESEIMKKLENGTYMDLDSNVWVTTDQNMLNDLQIGDTSFRTIALPAKECMGKPCTDPQWSSIDRCPCDDETYNGETCPNHNKCIKQKVLNSFKQRDSKVELSYTDDDYEINIMHVVTGFPLESLTRIMAHDKDEYNRTIKQNGGEEHADMVHMFGKVLFDQLDEKTLEMDEAKKALRKNLVMCSILNSKENDKKCLYVDKDGDGGTKVIYMMREDSLERPEVLGKTFAELENNFEKIEYKWISKFRKMREFCNGFKEELYDKEVIRERFLDSLKKWFADFTTKMPRPDGFKRNEENLAGLYRIAANDLHQDLSGEPLIKKETGGYNF